MIPHLPFALALATLAIPLLPGAETDGDARTPVALDLVPSRTFYSTFAATNDDGTGRLPFADYAQGLLIRKDTDGYAVDLDDDGRIAGDDPTGLMPGQRVAIPVVLDGRTQTYHLAFAGIGDRITAYSHCVARGSWNGVTFELIDANCNGRFDETGTDKVRERTDDTSQDITRRFAPNPCTGTYTSLGGELVTMHHSDDGRLAIAAYTGPLTVVTLSAADDGIERSCTLHSQDDETFQVPLHAGQTSTVPPGAYRIDQPHLRLPDPDRPEADGARLYWDRGEQPVITIAGERQTLDLGPPLTLSPTLVRRADEVRLTGLALIGGAGERYSAMVRSGTTPAKARWRLRRGEMTHEAGSLEYG